jgi:hypothetical protein
MRCLDSQKHNLQRGLNNGAAGLWTQCGAGSLGAALAIKELIAGKLKELSIFGLRRLSRKVIWQEQVYCDLDVCLDWHPDYENKANMQSSQAIADYTITFKGKVLMQQQIPGTVDA